MNIFFIRHGESEYNLFKKIAGTIDTPLTEKGIEQAKNSINLAKINGVTKIISSNLSRAKETAKIIADGLNLNVEVLSDLHECNYGNMQGKPNLPGVRTNMEMIQLDLCKGNESFSDLYFRAKRVISFLKKQRKEDVILCVGHGSFTSIIFAVNEGFSENELLDYRLNWNLKNVEIKELEIS